MMSLSLRAMRYVQAALKQGNISRAAETMNVAPSAIASALAQAEDTFGMALVTRARAKGIFPTPAGREIQHRIKDLLYRYVLARFRTGSIATSGRVLCRNLRRDPGRP